MLGKHIKPQLSSHHYTPHNMNSPNSNYCLDGFGNVIYSSNPLINWLGSKLAMAVVVVSTEPAARLL